MASSVDTKSIAVGDMKVTGSMQAESLRVVGNLEAGAFVGDQADFKGHVYIEKSLTVLGTTVGSGPYVDSSDVRFKKKIRTIDSPLEKVRNLRGVTYELRSEEFPKKNFGKETQMGWIAQEVEKVVPELVTTDADGFRAIAYARGSALVGQAVVELSDNVRDISDNVQNSTDTIRALSNTVSAQQKQIEMLMNELKVITEKIGNC